MPAVARSNSWHPGPSRVARDQAGSPAVSVPANPGTASARLPENRWREPSQTSPPPPETNCQPSLCCQPAQGPFTSQNALSRTQPGPSVSQSPQSAQCQRKPDENSRRAPPKPRQLPPNPTASTACGCQTAQYLPTPKPQNLWSGPGQTGRCAPTSRVFMKQRRPRRTCPAPTPIAQANPPPTRFHLGPNIPRGASTALKASRPLAQGARQRGTGPLDGGQCRTTAKVRPP